jgi:putative phosphoesterase
MLIGVISDTHSYMDPRARQLLRGVDHILHAGDIGNESVIRELAKIAPVTTVKGNVDRDGPVALYPEERLLELGGHRIYLTHALQPPRHENDPGLDRYRRNGVKVVVYGHSHIAYQRRWGDILFFNPGAAGKRRLKVIPSVGFLTLTGSSVYGQITEL